MRQARWITGCALACWVLLSISESLLIRKSAAPFWVTEGLGTIAAMPMLAVTFLTGGRPDWEAAWIFAVVFAALGIFAWVRGSRRWAVAFMAYFILCILLAGAMLLFMAGISYPGGGP